MSVEGQGVSQPSKRQLTIYLVAALLTATIVMILFVLPAEFRVDPTGFGAFSGLTRLAGARTPSTTILAESAAASSGPEATRYYPAAYRSDRIDIPLTAAGSREGGDELEYKVHMNAGDSFVYSWSTPDVANPDEFYYDFHGEAPAPNAATKAIVVEYRQATGTHSNGVLIAPISGVHGWYLQNQSAKPVVVHLKLSGFYELIAAGEYGNTAGIIASKSEPH